jgi:hypothetical protein
MSFVKAHGLTWKQFVAMNPGRGLDDVSHPDTATFSTMPNFPPGDQAAAADWKKKHLVFIVPCASQKAGQPCMDANGHASVTDVNGYCMNTGSLGDSDLGRGGGGGGHGGGGGGHGGGGHGGGGGGHGGGGGGGHAPGHGGGGGHGGGWGGGHGGGHGHWSGGHHGGWGHGGWGGPVWWGGWGGYGWYDWPWLYATGDTYVINDCSLESAAASLVDRFGNQPWWRDVKLDGDTISVLASDSAAAVRALPRAVCGYKVAVTTLGQQSSVSGVSALGAGRPPSLVAKIMAAPPGLGWLITTSGGGTPWMVYAHNGHLAARRHGGPGLPAYIRKNHLFVANTSSAPMAVVEWYDMNGNMKVLESGKISMGGVLVLNVSDQGAITAARPRRIADNLLGAPPAPQSRRYTVQKGDTFPGIARRFRTPAAMIVAANPGAARTTYKGMTILDLREQQVITVPIVAVPAGYAWDDATASFVRIGRVGQAPSALGTTCIPGNNDCPAGEVCAGFICVSDPTCSDKQGQACTAGTGFPGVINCDGYCIESMHSSFCKTSDGDQGVYDTHGNCVALSPGKQACENSTGVWSGGACSCPNANTTLQNGVCVASYYDNKSGQPCPVANMTKDTNGICHCPAGRVYDEVPGQGPGCYYCDPGATYNPNTHGCDCDAGLIYQPSSDSCVVPVVCGPGTTDDGNNGCRPVVASDCAAGETFDPNGQGGYRCFACNGKGSVYDMTAHDCVCPKGTGWSDKDNACVQGSPPKPPPPVDPPCDQGKTRTAVELTQDGVTYAPGACVPPPRPPVKHDEAPAAEKSNTALIVALALAGTAGAIGIGYALNKNSKKKAR